jgi:predicted metalloendopeptidase
MTPNSRSSELVPADDAQSVLETETGLAKISMERVKRRDPQNRYNRRSTADLVALVHDPQVGAARPQLFLVPDLLVVDELQDHRLTPRFHNHTDLRIIIHSFPVFMYIYTS